MVQFYQGQDTRENKHDKEAPEDFEDLGEKARKAQEKAEEAKKSNADPKAQKEAEEEAYREKEKHHNAFLKALQKAYNNDLDESVVQNTTLIAFLAENYDPEAGWGNKPDGTPIVFKNKNTGNLVSVTKDSIKYIDANKTFEFSDAVEMVQFAMLDKDFQKEGFNVQDATPRELAKIQAAVEMINASLPKSQHITMHNTLQSNHPELIKARGEATAYAKTHDVNYKTAKPNDYDLGAQKSSNKHDKKDPGAGAKAGAAGAGAKAGNTGGAKAGNTGGAKAGNTGGAKAGNTGGAKTGNTGGAKTGNTGGAKAGNTGGAKTGNTGGAKAGNTGGAKAGNTGGAKAGNTGGAKAGNTGGAKAGNTGGAKTDAKIRADFKKAVGSPQNAEGSSLEFAFDKETIVRMRQAFKEVRKTDNTQEDPSDKVVDASIKRVFTKAAKVSGKLRDDGLIKLMTDKLNFIYQGAPKYDHDKMIRAYASKNTP